MVVTAAASASSAAAAATLLHDIWIRHGEAPVHQAFDVIDLGALDVRKTINIDDEADPAQLDNGVIRRDFVVKPHAVTNAAVV